MAPAPGRGPLLEPSHTVFMASMTLVALCVAFLLAQALRHFRAWRILGHDPLHLYAMIWSLAILLDLIAVRVAAFVPYEGVAWLALQIQAPASVVALGAALRLAYTIAGREPGPVARRIAAAGLGAAVLLVVAGLVTPHAPMARVWDSFGFPQRILPLTVPIAVAWCGVVVPGIAYAVWLVGVAPIPRLDRMFFAGAFAVSAGGAVNDLLVTAGSVHSAFVFPYTVLTVNIALDVLLAGRMAGLQRSLATEVDAQTSALAEKNQLLADALARAEALGRARGQFVANLSHEIRTPMNGILGMTRLLLDHESRPLERERLQMVRTSADVLLRLLNDLLDLARMDAGRLELEPDAFSVGGLVEEVVLAASAGAERKGLVLTADVAAGVPETVVGDRLRLRQVLTNLVDNAVKFTARGEVVVRVEPVLSDAPGGTVRFEVADTGPGIPPDQQARVFEPFAQGDASTARLHGGTGLGLAICRQLVALMGGHLALHSTEGLGSSFWFQVPLPAVASTATEAPPRRVPSGFPVVVHETHAGSARAIRRVLEELDARLVTDDGGDPAAAAAARPVGSLWIVDLARTTAAGLVVGRARGPVAVLAASDIPAAERARLRKEGITVVLRPFRREELVSVVAAASAGWAPGPSRRLHTPAPARSLVVLVADDHLVNRRLLTALLERAGHEVVTAEDGAQVIDVWAAGGLDLVLLDVQMPRMDGVEAARRIRAAEPVGGPRVPIVAITAHADPAETVRILSAGIDAIVPKPVGPEELFAAVDRVVSRPAASDVAPPRADPPAAPIFDRAGLLARVAGDLALFDEIVGLFLADLGPLVDSLHAASREGSAEDLARFAHRLKGSSANAGAERLRGAAAGLEAAARGRGGTVTEAIAAVEAEIGRVRPELEAWRADRGAGR